MDRLAIATLLISMACGRAANTTAPMRAPDLCDDYRRAVSEARTDRGTVDAEVQNACGCPTTLQTTAQRAKSLSDALARVDGAKTRCSINCDQPCSPNDSRW